MSLLYIMGLLHDACDTLSVEKVKKVFSQHLDVDERDENGNTALHVSTGSYSNPEIVKLLLKKGANVHIKNKKGDTPLHIACEHGNDVIVAALLAAGSKINVKNKKGDTPLHNACWVADAGCRPDIVKILLQHGANVSTKNKFGLTPLVVAIRTECVDVINQLLNACKPNCGTVPLDDLKENEWLDKETKKKFIRRLKSLKSRKM